MKKFLALLLASLMLFSLAACTNRDDDTVIDNNDETVTNDPGNSNDTADKTVGNVLLDSFNALVFDGTASAEEIVNALSANSIIPFGPVTAPVEEGFLQGFDNDITGFKSGAVFMPMIGSIPFVCYVFELEDAQSAVDFSQVLKDNANPRWNVCVEAEETVCDTNGNFVFFCMANRSFEEQPADDGVIEDDIIYDDEIIIDDTPAADDTAADVDAPVADEPVADEPVADEPVADEPVADEPVADEPVADEPVVDEPVVDEPVVDEPVADEPVADEPEADGDLTAANSLAKTFHELLSENTYETPEMLLLSLESKARLPFMTTVVSMSEGYMPGFDSDITGFKSAAVYMPIIGSIPFVTYVFELEDTADMDAFVQTLKDNSNPRWNICVAAEETVCETNGNYVFFCMSPLTFEE